MTLTLTLTRVNISRESIILGAVCLFDLILTLILIQSGLCTEANPILARCLEYGMGAMTLAKLASFLIPLALAEWYRRRRPEFIRGLLRATLCLYILGYVAGVSAIHFGIIGG